MTRSRSGRIGRMSALVAVSPDAISPGALPALALDGLPVAGGEPVSTRTT